MHENLRYSFKYCNGGKQGESFSRALFCTLGKFQNMMTFCLLMMNFIASDKFDENIINTLYSIYMVKRYKE